MDLFGKDAVAFWSSSVGLVEEKLNPPFWKLLENREMRYFFPGNDELE